MNPFEYHVTIGKTSTTLYYKDLKAQKGAEEKTAAILRALAKVSLGKVPSPDGRAIGEMSEFAARIFMVDEEWNPFYQLVVSTDSSNQSLHDACVRNMMSTMHRYPAMGYTGPMLTSRFLRQLFFDEHIDSTKYPSLSQISELVETYPMTDRLPEPVLKDLAPLDICYQYGGVCFGFDDSEFHKDGNSPAPIFVLVAFHGKDDAERLEKPQYQGLQQYLALYIFKELQEAFRYLYPNTIGPIINLPVLRDNLLTATFINYLKIEEF